MSKINNVRLPNAAAVQYSPEQFNQLVRSLEQIVLQLNNTYTPTTTDDSVSALRWFSAAPGASGFTANTRGGQLVSGNSAPFAMLMSSIDQPNAGITSENLIIFDVVPVSNGIYIENNTRIKVPAAGHYLISFSLQVTNRGNTAAEFEVWAKDTGVNFPLSNTRFDIPARKSTGIWSHIVPCVSGIFSVSNPATDYLELAWWAGSTDVYLEHYPAGTSPTRPEIPSVILTISFVSATAIGGSATANVSVTLSSVSGTASLGTASAGPAIFVSSGTVVGTGNISSPTVTGTAVAPVSGIGTFGYAGIVDIPLNDTVAVVGVSGQGLSPSDVLAGEWVEFGNSLINSDLSPYMYVYSVTEGSSILQIATLNIPSALQLINPGRNIKFSNITPVPSLPGKILGGISLNDLISIFPYTTGPTFEILNVGDPIVVPGSEATYRYWTVDTGQIATSTATSAKGAWNVIFYL